MIRQILDKFGIIQAIKRYRMSRQVNAEKVREENLVIGHLSDDKFLPLSASEKEQIEELWGSIDNISERSYREFEMFKKLNGFDARYLTHYNYLPILAHLLNDYRYTKIYDDKGLLGYLKPTHMRFPKCYVRRIVSDFYDNEMHQINFDQAVDSCSKTDEIFIKPSHETSGGKGAKLLRLKGLSFDERKKIIQEELSGRQNDYVVQECICQHSVMSQFNPSSVNTLRITTLMLNGKFSLCSIILRCGMDGSTVDNWGAGGLVVNVSPDGIVNSVAHDIYLNEYKSNGGCVFENCSIPQMPDILKMLEQCHKEDFAICKFIGWDIAIDKDGCPIIIELNSSQPGVIGEQLIAGPIFGNRTQEVIDYCKTKRFSY